MKTECSEESLHGAQGLSAHMTAVLVLISLINRGQAALVRNHHLVDWILTRCNKGPGKVWLSMGGP